jgi:hypothetical protein
VLAPGVTIGRVLVALEPLNDRVVHLREVQTPLRDLLAEMYRRERTDEDSP